jgi:very-short-patch-repair endonuclease
MENYICKFCGKVCKNPNSLRNHERLCKLNPNRDERSYQNLIKGHEITHHIGHTAWNKGLTKESDERIKRQGETYSSRYKTGSPEAKALGHVMTEEIKKKISETQKKNYTGRSRYATAREHRCSYAESYFTECFTDAVKQLHVDRYFLDFAWPDIKIYIEIDGEQHYVDHRIVEHDKIRTQRLHELGWRLLTRIRWSEFQKLEQSEKENLVFRLLQTIKIQKLQ